MAGQNTILFLFSRNDLKPNTESKKVTFTFGEPPKPCEYPLQIDPDNNLFDMGCNCHYVDYDTNIINIDCNTETGPSNETCIYWVEQDEGFASFNCPCVPYNVNDDTNVDFVIDCEGTGTNPGTSSVILGTLRNYFGTSSSTLFSIELSNVNYAYGYYSLFEMSVANMRIETIAYAGYYVSSILSRIQTFDITYSVGYAFVPTIVYDPYHKFFEKDEDNITFGFGTAGKSVIVYDPYNKFSETDIVNYYGLDTKSSIVFNPYNKFSESDLTLPWGNSLTNTVVFNPYHKFSEDVLALPWGTQSTTFLLYDQYNKLSTSDLVFHYGVEADAFILYDQYTQMLEGDITAYFENYDSKAVIVYNPYHEFSKDDLTLPWGVRSTAFILFNQYNILWDEALTFVEGMESHTIIVYDPYHPFLDEDESISFGFGYAPHSVIVYNPYHVFFKDKDDSTKAVFGYSPHTQIVYNPYHEFFKNKDGNVTFGFGHELKNVFVFNPYNQFNPAVIKPFYADWVTKSDIRYNDDHRITKEDLELTLDISSKSEMKLANIYANLGTTLPYGFESNNIIMTTPGFIGTGYVGYATNIKYLTYRIPYPTFGICISAMGYELHDNQRKPRFFDMSANVCCTKKPYELLHIEMTEYDDWDVLYGNEHGWGIACVASLCAQPRMSAKSYFGSEAEVHDTTIYLGQVEIGAGIAMHARGLQFDSSIELGNGNFITDQNEVKVELTKPDDELTTIRSMFFGMAWHINLGVPYGLKVNPWYYGAYSSTEMRVEEALRGSFHFAWWSQFTLNNTSRLSAREYFGYSGEARFYEPPYYMYYGMSMECDALITENWVEFLEEGELNNEYLFQNKNGDIDESRPNGESIEGYPFTRYIKGRCY